MDFRSPPAAAPAQSAGPAPALPAGLSVIVPVYNSQATLGELLDRLEPVLRDVAEHFGGGFEAVLVNDGSRDRSWEAVGRARAGRDWVRGIDLMRNYGQHNALLCGVRAARFATVATIDDDLQNPPEEIPRLLAKLNEAAPDAPTPLDVVYGKPRGLHHGVWRNLASRITKAVLQKAMGADTARNISAFRVFRTNLRDAFASYRSPFVSIDVLLTWGTTRFAAVEVRHDPRAAGESNYTLRKLLVHALNMVTGFSTWPLQLASFIGFAFTLVGILILLFVVGRYFIGGGQRVQGFAFTASLIAIFSGAQLFALGIIGEYLARLHFRTMERPTYTVRQEAEGDGATSDGATSDGATSDGATSDGPAPEGTAPAATRAVQRPAGAPAA